MGAGVTVTYPTPKFQLAQEPPIWYNQTMSEKLPAKDYSPATKSGAPSKLCRKFLEEYRKDLDPVRALDTCEIPEEEREKFLNHYLVAKAMAKADKWLEIEPRWNKEAALAEHQQVMDMLIEQVAKGNPKAANPLASLIKLKMESTGMLQKEKQNTGTVVNFNFDLGTQNGELKVVNNGDEDNE